MSKFFKDTQIQKASRLKVLFYKIYGRKQVVWDRTANDKAAKMTAYWFRGRTVVTELKYYDK